MKLTERLSVLTSVGNEHMTFDLPEGTDVTITPLPPTRTSSDVVVQWSGDRSRPGLPTKFIVPRSRLPEYLR